MTTINIIITTNVTIIKMITIIIMIQILGVFKNARMIIISIIRIMNCIIITIITTIS